jgi:tRNA wybutosine-synthesizing protein 3
MRAGAKLVLRFEPFILHVECRNMAAAQRLLLVARLAGYRESGATVGEAAAPAPAAACTPGAWRGGAAAGMC